MGLASLRIRLERAGALSGVYLLPVLILSKAAREEGTRELYAAKEIAEGKEVEERRE